MTRLASHCLSALLIALTLAACGNDEPAPEEGHTPADAALFVGGVDVSAAWSFRQARPCVSRSGSWTSTAT